MDKQTWILKNSETGVQINKWIGRKGDRDTGVKGKVQYVDRATVKTGRQLNKWTGVLQHGLTEDKWAGRKDDREIGVLDMRKMDSDIEKKQG